jgi:hypothetical protein
MCELVTAAFELPGASLPAQTTDVGQPRRTGAVRSIPTAEDLAAADPRRQGVIRSTGFPEQTKA